YSAIYHSPPLDFSLFPHEIQAQSLPPKGGGFKPGTLKIKLPDAINRGVHSKILSLLSAQHL
ncbi:MAG: hypothetical protein LBT14_08545, partial [Treponema sp.]|nr:hypothetical protein [Treponema sp.]